MSGALQGVVKKLQKKKKTYKTEGVTAEEAILEMMLKTGFMCLPC